MPKIEDSYAYNGEGLRTAQTISGTTTYLAWDMTKELPLILSDGTNSYIYGPDGLPIEQISSGGTVSYLHHDQQGSTRLLTGSTGTVTGKCTYSAYGAPTCEGTTTTPIGYDAQYTSSGHRPHLHASARPTILRQHSSLRSIRLHSSREAYTPMLRITPLNRADLTGLCTGFGPAPAGCKGGSGELGPHVFCEPTRHETEETHREIEKAQEEKFKNEEIESKSKLAGQEAWGSGAAAGSSGGGEPKDAPPEADPE